jgi:hypothetical protein
MGNSFQQPHHVPSADFQSSPFNDYDATTQLFGFKSAFTLTRPFWSHNSQSFPLRIYRAAIALRLTNHFATRVSDAQSVASLEYLRPPTIIHIIYDRALTQAKPPLGQAASQAK